MRTLGVSQAQINKVKIWIAFNPPTLSGGSYSAWEIALFREMQSVGITVQQLTQIAKWVDSASI
jgi:hypothetical protein